MTQPRIPPSAADTVDALERIARANPGWKVEREADGWFTMSPTGSLSGAHGIALAGLLIPWAATVDGVLFDSSAGFTMPDTSVLSPDTAWIHRARWDGVSANERLGYATIVPDVCIEIASPSDRLPALRDKVRRYIAFGAAFAVLIDPAQRSVETYGRRPDGFPTDFTSVFDAGT